MLEVINQQGVDHVTTYNQPLLKGTHIGAYINHALGSHQAQLLANAVEKAVIEAVKAWVA